MESRRSCQRSGCALYVDRILKYSMNIQNHVIICRLLNHLSLIFDALQKDLPLVDSVGILQIYDGRARARWLQTHTHTHLATVRSYTKSDIIYPVFPHTHHPIPLWSTHFRQERKLLIYCESDDGSDRSTYIHPPSSSLLWNMHNNFSLNCMAPRGSDFISAIAEVPSQFHLKTNWFRFLLQWACDQNWKLPQRVVL